MVKEEKLTNWQKILIVFLLGGLIYTVFGINDLTRWYREIEHRRPRILFHILLAPISAFAEGADIARIADDYKDHFHGMKEKGFEELFPETSLLIAEKLPAVFFPNLHASEQRAIIENTGKISYESGDSITENRDSESSLRTDIPGGNTPAAESSEQERPICIPEEKSVLLVGDSLANSCSTSLIPLANRMEHLNLTKYGKVSANLSNSVFDQWFEELDPVLEKQDFDIIILMMGANAVQAISEGDDRWAYGSEEWERIYRRRAEDLIEKMKLNTERIYWIGIPPMMKQNYSASMKGHNRRIAEICRETGINYLPIDSIMGDEEGRYQEYMIIDGRQVRIRHSDGIHYSRAGSDLLSRYILKSVFPDIDFSSRGS